MKTYFTLSLQLIAFVAFCQTKILELPGNYDGSGALKDGCLAICSEENGKTFITKVDSKGNRIYKTEYLLKGKEAYTSQYKSGSCVITSDNSEGVFFVRTEKSNVYVVGIDATGKAATKTIVMAKDETPVSACVTENQLYILTLDHGTKWNMNAGWIPDGNYKLITLSTDLVESTKKLNIPSWTHDKGQAQNRLISASKNELFFVSEFKEQTGEETFQIRYELKRYDLKSDKIIASMKHSIDFGGNCPRMTNGSSLNKQKIVSLYLDFDAPANFVDTDGSVYFFGTTGIGNPANTLKRRHEGIFVLKFNPDFTMAWKSFTSHPESAKGMHALRDPQATHQGMFAFKKDGKVFFEQDAKFSAQSYCLVHTATADGKIDKGIIFEDYPMQGGYAINNSRLNTYIKENYKVKKVVISLFPMMPLGDKIAAIENGKNNFSILTF